MKTLFRKPRLVGGLIVTALMVVPMALAACGGTETVTVVETVVVEKVVEVPAATEPQEFQFYSVYHTFPHPFWAMMGRAAELAGSQLNVGADFHIFPEYSVEDQINRIESLTAKKPDGIAMSFPDAVAADSVVRAAIDSGIPIVAVNARDPRPKADRIPYLFYVGSDELIAGARVAEEILFKYGTPKRVAFAGSQIANIAQSERHKGGASVLVPMGITTDLVDVDKDPTVGSETVRNWMAAHPETDWWVCLESLCQVTVTEALKDMGTLNNGVRVAGFDLGEIVNPLIEGGDVLFTIDQQPYLQGYLPVLWLYLYNKAGFLPAGDVLTGPAVVDKSNIGLVKELADVYR